MANRHFPQMREQAEKRQVLQIEIVTCIDAEAQRMCEFRRFGVRFDARITSARFERTGKRFGVQLYPIATDRGRPFHRIGDRIDEQAHPNPDLLETPDNRRELPEDRKSTRLNSSHSQISYAVFCLKKKKKKNKKRTTSA